MMKNVSSTVSLQVSFRLCGILIIVKSIKRTIVSLIGPVRQFPSTNRPWNPFNLAIKQVANTW